MRTGHCSILLLHLECVRHGLCVQRHIRLPHVMKGWTMLQQHTWQQAGDQKTKGREQSRSGTATPGSRPPQHARCSLSSLQILIRGVVAVQCTLLT